MFAFAEVHSCFQPHCNNLKDPDHAFTLSRKAASTFSLSSLTLRAVGEKVCCLMELARCSFPRCLKVAIDLRIAAEGRNSWVCRAPIPWHNGFWGRKCYYNLYPQPLGCSPKYHNSEQDRHSHPARARAGCREQELGTMGRIWGAAAATSCPLFCTESQLLVQLLLRGKI